MKKPICKVCKYRRVNQQEWKTEEEKGECFTCNTMKKFLQQTAEMIQNEIDSRNINREIYIVLTDKKVTPEQKLLRAITGNVQRVKILDRKIGDETGDNKAKPLTDVINHIN